MAVLKIILTVVFIIISIALTVIILMQESQERLILTGARTKDVPWKEDW